MSNIEQNLAFILSSRYGEDVRQAIHDAIHDCYEDGKSRAVDLVAREQIANLVATVPEGTEKDSELIDIRVGWNSASYTSAGKAVRDQFEHLYNSMFYNVQNLRYIADDDSPSSNFKILPVYIEEGTTIYFKSLSGYSNILATYSDSSNGIIVPQFDALNGVVAYTATKTIIYLGLYCFNKNTLSDILVFGDYSIRNIELIDSKVDGLFYNETKVPDSSVLTKVFRIINNAVDIYDFSPGSYMVFNIPYGTKKVKISGYAWEKTEYFYLYCFTNANGTVIGDLPTDYSSEIVSDLDVTVPIGAKKLYVNGNGVGSIKISYFSYTNDFEECLKILHVPVQNTSVKFITLGDSITKLGTSENGWIKYFIEKTKANLIANVAMDGAVLSDYEDTVYDGNPQNSNQKNNVLGNQVQKIINNAYEDPDVIIIAIGTNGGIYITEEQIKNAYYTSDGDLIDLDLVDRTTDAGAYRYAFDTLHDLYPNALIFWSAPILADEKTRDATSILQYMNSLKNATDFTGQIMIDTVHCGINGINEHTSESGEYLYDGLHPNANGAKKIGYYIANKVLSFL